MSALPPVFVEFIGSIGRFKSSVNEVKREMLSVEKKGGSTFSKFAAGATKGLGLVGVAAGLAAVKAVGMASSFQAEMVLLHTAAGESVKNLKLVSDGALSIARSTGVGTDEIAKGLYTVEKAGNRGADALKITKAAAQGAVAEGVSMSTMTQALTSVMYTYHVKASGAVATTNQLVVAAGESKTNMAEFAGSLSTVLPIAQAAGLSFAQVGGALSVLTQHGTTAFEATQELSNTIRNLQAPNQVAMKAMQQLGLSVTDVEKGLGRRGLTGTLEMFVKAAGSHMKGGLVMVDAFNKSKSAGQDLNKMFQTMPGPLQKISAEWLKGSLGTKAYRTDIKGLGAQGYAMGSQFLSLGTTAKGFNALLRSGQPEARTMSAALKQMLGGSTALNTVLQLTGKENMPKFLEAVKRIGDAAHKTGSNISTWAATSGTLKNQLARVKESIQTGMIAVGLKLIPIVQKLIKYIGTELGYAIKNVEAWFNRNKQTIMEVAHVIGVVLVTAWNGLIVIAKTVINVIEAIVGFFGKYKLITVMVVGAIGGYLLVMAAMKIATIASSIATGIMTTAQLYLNASMDANPIGLFVAAIAALALGLMYAYNHSKGFRDIIHAIGTGLAWVWHNVLEPVVNFFKNNWKTALVVAAAVILPFVALPILIVKHWQDIVDFFKALPGRIWGFLKDAGKWLLGLGGDIIKGLWTGIKLAFKAVVWFFLDFPILMMKWFAKANSWLLQTGWHIILGFLKGIGDAAVGLWHWFSSLPGWILSKLGSLANTLAGAAWAMIRGFITGIGRAAQGIWDWFSNLPSMLASAIGDVASWGWNIAKDMILGIAGGFANLASWVWGKIKHFFTGLWNDITSFFHIGSPSKLFRDELGKQLMLGMAEGITRNGHHVHNAMKAVNVGLMHVAMSATGPDVGLGSLAGGGSSSSSTYVVQMTVHGSVLSDNDLIQKVEQGFQRAGARRGRTYLPFSR